MGNRPLLIGVSIISGCGVTQNRRKLFGDVPLPLCYNSPVARVLMVSSEAAPLAKTGGLADVVGALPAALRSLGDEVAVVIPRYASIDLKRARRVYDNLPIHLGAARFDTS